MPRAMSVLGWGLGIFTILVFALLEVYSGVMLAKVFEGARTVSGRKPFLFSHLGEAAYGKRGMRWVAWCQYPYLWSFCVVVQLIAANVSARINMCRSSLCCPPTASHLD